MSSLEKLKSGGVIEFASSDDIDLDNQTYTFYAGFDPTAESLHVGSLFVLITMKRLQLLGHKPIAILGGATGMIGDPSGKSKERVLLTEDIIEKNVNGMKAQIEKFISVEEGGVIVNNMDWMKEFSFIAFLRDVGKLFRVSEMISKESVQKRLNSEEGISFTEFSYQILQSYDFLHLFQEYGCNLQLGGSDQWGNISAGITLIRKETSRQAYGLTIPLIKSSSGEKFGKSEGQNIWLDPNLTSPYQFYQFWIQTSDEDVIQYLRYFTFLSEDEIKRLEQSTKDQPEAREAQKSLAYEITSLLHSKEEADKAIQASKILFGGSMEGMNDKDLSEIFSDVPHLNLNSQSLSEGQLGLLDVLVESSLCKSRGQARNLVKQGGVYLNNERVEDDTLRLSSDNLLGEGTMVLRTGRKKYCLLSFKGESC